MPKNVTRGSAPRRATLPFTTSSSLAFVGIGASARGMRSLKALLKGVKSRVDCVIGVVQHLHPDHESLAVKVLSICSPLPVEEIRDGMLPQAGRLYVVPSGVDLLLSKGRFRLVLMEPKDGMHTTIARFFKSIGSECGSRSTGVVLSGTGKNGAEGLRSLLKYGGAAYAERPESAHYPDMPRAALAVEGVKPITASAFGRHLRLTASAAENQKLPCSDWSFPCALDGVV